MGLTEGEAAEERICSCEFSPRFFYAHVFEVALFSLFHVLELNPPRRMVLVLVIERVSPSTSTSRSTSTNELGNTSIGAPRGSKCAASKLLLRLTLVCRLPELTESVPLRARSRPHPIHRQVSCRVGPEVSRPRSVALAISERTCPQTV